MNRIYIPILFFILTLSACIGTDIIDDEIDERIQISSSVDTLEVSGTYQFEATFFDNIGQEAIATIEWESTAPEVVSIDQTGLATALQKGNADIIASVFLPDEVISDTASLAVGEETVIIEQNTRTGVIATTSFYVLEGDFTLIDDEGILRLDIAENYRADSALPGLYLYLTNNPNTVNGAFEVGRVTTFSGAHTYELPEDIDLFEYNYLLYFCKPFGVKVGDGLIGE